MTTFRASVETCAKAASFASDPRVAGSRGGRTVTGAKRRPDMGRPIGSSRVGTARATAQGRAGDDVGDERVTRPRRTGWRARALCSQLRLRARPFARGVTVGATRRHAAIDDTGAPDRGAARGFDQVAFFADALGSAALEFSAARRSSQAAFLRARRRRSRRRARGSWGVDMRRFLADRGRRVRQNAAPDARKPHDRWRRAGAAPGPAAPLRRRDGPASGRGGEPRTRRASWRSAEACRTSSESRRGWSEPPARR